MLKSRFTVVMLTGFALLAGAPLALAEPKSKEESPQQVHSPQQGKGSQSQKGAPPQSHKSQGGKPADDGKMASSPVGDLRVDRDRIRVTIGDSRDYWSPGPPLPPGIRKNLQRGKPLPPGIAKQQLDSRLERQLPHYYGHEWVRVGNDLVLISVSAQVINEVLHDIFN